MCLLFKRHKKILLLKHHVAGTSDDPLISTNLSYIPNAKNTTDYNYISGTGLYMDINDSVLLPTIKIKNNPLLMEIILIMIITILYGIGHSIYIHLLA